MRFDREENRIFVLQALSILGKAQAHTITDYINNPPTKQQPIYIIPTTDQHLPQHKQRQVKREYYTEEQPKKQLSKRTIESILKDLKREGLAEITDYYYYSLTNTAREDPRYLPKLWNLKVLGKVFEVGSLQELVNNVGFMVVYSLIMSTKPFSVGKSGLHKNELALQWLHHSVSLEWLLMGFMAEFVRVVRRGGSEDDVRFEVSTEKYEELSNMLKKVNPKLFKEFKT